MNHRPWSAILVLLLMLGGCGFQLRGMPAAGFKHLYMSGNMDPVADQELNTLLSHETGMIRESNADHADVLVYLSPITITRQILTLNIQGTVSQYTLYARLKFRATDALGNELITPTTLTEDRVFNYNDIQIFSMASQEQILYHDMKIDLVRRMMRRILILHPTAPPLADHANHHP